MTSLTKLTKEILKHRGLNPKKYLSQNFLVDKGVYDAIIKTGNLSSDDYVIEIGPGLGFLTTELTKHAGQVVSIEIDKELAQGLADLEAITDNLTIINDDILHLDLATLPSFTKTTKYKVIANIPYHLTAKIFKMFLSQEHKPEIMVILVQKEVAQRVVADTGQHSRLSLSIQLYGQPKLVRMVSQASFYPQPKVDSAILLIEKNDKYIKKLNNEELFWKVVRAAFTGKRKKITNTLASAFNLEKSFFVEKMEELNIETGSRPQHLSVGQWIDLVNLLDKDNLLK